MNNQVASQRRLSANKEQREWTGLDEQIYGANELLIAHKHDIHAIYETRERKRNAQLGLPPTLAELVDLLRDQPPMTANLDAETPNSEPAELKLTTPANIYP
jgi:hypothetical protein